VNLGKLVDVRLINSTQGSPSTVAVSFNKKVINNVVNRLLTDIMKEVLTGSCWAGESLGIYLSLDFLHVTPLWPFSNSDKVTRQTTADDLADVRASRQSGVSL
jgi:hypothetical protein